MIPRYRRHVRSLVFPVVLLLASLVPLPDDVPWTGVAGLQAQTPAPDTLQARADAMWRAGEIVEAERLYRIVLAEDANDTRALQRLALSAAWAGRHGEALALIDRVLALEPANVDAALDRARFLAWQGRTDAALASLDALERAYPGNPAIRRERARALGLAGEYRAARASWVALLTQDPGDLESRLGLARLLAVSDRLDEALEQYDMALGQAPGNPEALAGRGRTLGWAGRLVEAEAWLRASVRQAPSDPELRSALAQVLAWQGRTAAALQEVRQAERLAPGRLEIREQREELEAMAAPTLRVGVAAEGDSDENRMNTVTLTALATSLDRLTVRGDVYRRFLRQEGLEREASGGQLTAALLLEPGWTVAVGGGNAWTDVTGSETLTTASATLASPRRYPLVVSGGWSRTALDATAVLAQRGVRVDASEVEVRWTPGPRWTVEGSGGRALFRGVEENERLSGTLAVARRVAREWTVGVSGRAFGFDRQLQEGYFSPERFQLAEGTTRWLRDVERWGLQAEGGVGAQRIGEGDPTLAVRLSSRVGFRPGAGREVHLGGVFSTAGVQAFASGEDYRYAALVVGISWAF